MFQDDLLASGISIDDDTATRLVRMRNAYDYPRAYMRLSTEPTQFYLGVDAWAEPMHPVRGEITDLELDRHHAMLLNSSDPVQNLLGTLSTVFWGFYTSNPQRALLRASRHLEGYRTKPRSTATSVAQALRSPMPLNLGSALGSLASLSQLGQTPFGSKVIAFKHPSVAGVLDNQLNKGFKRSVWAQGAPFIHGIGGVHELRYQKRFEAWCQFLCTVASRMNAGIADRRLWHWQSTETAKQQWRAVDVERAIFKSFRM